MVVARVSSFLCWPIRALPALLKEHSKAAVPRKFQEIPMENPEDGVQGTFPLLLRLFATRPVLGIPVSVSSKA